MGMLGQWVSRPRRVEDLDTAINNASAETLEAMMQDIEDGQLFLDFRDTYDFAPVPPGADPSTLASIRADDDHIRQHWFNEDEAGWWPFDPTHEIRTETLYRVAGMVRQSLNGPGPRKRANSIWMCPGQEHFRSLILDGASDIMIVYLSPPEDSWSKEPLPSAHRADYDDEVAAYFRRSMGDTCVRQGDAEVLVPGVRGVDPVDRYQPGTRVRLSNGAGFEIFRTVLQVHPMGDDDMRLTLRSGRGSLAQDIPSGVLRIHPLGGLNERTLHQRPQLSFNHPQNIWTISGLGRNSKFNVEVHDPVVTGVSVVQNLGQRPRGA